MSSRALAARKPFGAATLQDAAQFIVAAKISYAQNFGEQQAELLDMIMHIPKIQEH